MGKKLVLCFLFILPVYAYSQNADIRILRAINSPEILPSDKFFQLISNSEVYLSVGIPVGIGTAALIKHDEKLFRNACVILSATVLNAGITTAMKYSFNRDRPFVTYPDITKKSAAGSPSFPSGHTSGAFATATSLSLAWRKWYIIVPSYTWAGAVGYSRMYLGVHYPSDVLAGALIGSGCAWLTYAVNKKLKIKAIKKPAAAPSPGFTYKYPL
jgi:membrane-associated phospholipid phosphatase